MLLLVFLELKMLKTYGIKLCLQKHSWQCNLDALTANSNDGNFGYDFLLCCYCSFNDL